MDKYQDHNSNLKISFNKDSFLFLNGEIVKLGRLEYTELKFYPHINQEVYSRHYGERVKGTLIGFNQKSAKILVNGKVKENSIMEFISNNKEIETSIRIEDKDGVGPYNSIIDNEELFFWQECQKNFSTKKQPPPEFDHGLSRWPLVGYHSKFGFSTYSQMFNWFSLEDVSFLMKNEFEIKFKQKGLDYFDSISGQAQVAMIHSEEAYKAVLNCPKSL